MFENVQTEKQPCIKKLQGAAVVGHVASGTNEGLSHTKTVCIGL